MFAADALQEMLFQMKDGKIRLFPAVPKTWTEKQVSFYSFRGEKGILCSAEIFEGRKLSWKIYTENSVYIQIQYQERLCGEKRLEPGQWWEESLMLE